MSTNPVSTYRIQFNKDFTFSDLEKIIPYLQRMGIKTIYASPIFESVPGSLHGYDGTDPNEINPEIGKEEQLFRISRELKKRNMYWLQDIVPNHLAFHENNQWLMDVMEKGQSSHYSSYFDIIWDHPDFNCKLMVPFPGSTLEKELKARWPDEKNYVITPWQETDRRINYRRFFLVNDLICTNIHDDTVFEHYHTLIKKLISAKVFDGLRVDHIDGLFDPTKYLHDLRKLAGDNAYIIVEKILEPEEEMYASWPVQGNTGYDFLAMVNNLFTNRNAEYELTTLYYDITGDNRSVELLFSEKKTYILHQYMNGELDNLVRLYRQEGLADGLDDDQTRNLISDYLINCPVYRYYDDIPCMGRDKGKRGMGVNKFYNRCMQFTGPLMAKGIEDTLMYTYNRFTGHNEVGDSPAFFGYTVNQFHVLMIRRQEHWPLSMNGTSTHDTKRSEDVRARLNTLTCFHEEWTSLVHRWMNENAHLKTNDCPDKNDEYFIYQTIAGSHPMINTNKEFTKDEFNYTPRLEQYFPKALREAKIHTNWTEPNLDYEQACIQFVKKILEKNSDFNKTFRPFLEKISYYGMINSICQMVLKFTCPGIPDIYQGTECWDLSLVDPDNRRPVDYEMRMKMLENDRPFDELWETRWTGQIKLSLLNKLLQLRNEYTDIFTKGEYIPITIEGKHKDHAIAFMRKLDRTAIAVFVSTHYPFIEADVEKFRKDVQQSIPKNLFQRKLLHFADFFQVKLLRES